MKVIASDIDNTLFFSGKFKEQDIEKIKEFQSKGNLFGVCTGRPFNGVTDICKDVFEPDFYIVSTGAYILSKDLKVIFEKNIDRSLMYELYDLFSKRAMFYVQADGIAYTFKDKHPRHQRHMDSIDEVVGKIQEICLSVKTKTEAHKIVEEINDKYTNLTAFQNECNIDIVAKGCSKGHGLRIIKEYYNMKQIAGIGDSFNDIPLFLNTEPSFSFTYSDERVQDYTDYVVNDVCEALEILIEA